MWLWLWNKSDRGLIRGNATYYKCLRHLTKPKITFSTCTHESRSTSLQVKEQLTPTRPATKPHENCNSGGMSGRCSRKADLSRQARPRLVHGASTVRRQGPRAKAKLTVAFTTLVFSGASRRRTTAMRSSLCFSSSDSLLIHASWFLSLSSLFAWATFLPVKQNQTTAMDIFTEQIEIESHCHFAHII